VVAGLLEIGWPLGLKIAEGPDRGVQGFTMAILFMATSGPPLAGTAQHSHGNAYAAWTGISAVGTLTPECFRSASPQAC
jgi:quaternary ammonium compound-resistance protein SugE